MYLSKKKKIKNITLQTIFAIIFSLPPLETLLATGVLVVLGIFNRKYRTFATYTLTNPATGQVYVGRCSGFGDIENIVIRRLRSHKYFKRGFTIIQIDKAMQGKEARAAIRGREQQLIDFYGGIRNPQVANIIRAVAKLNPKGRRFHRNSSYFFGELHFYTGF